MQKLFFLTLVFLFGHTIESLGQYEFPEMGKYTDGELKMTECSFDKDAVAVILLDAAIADHDDDYHLITQHRTRIKILSDKGFDYANIVIPYYTKEDFEKITKLKGIISNPGEPVRTLDQSAFFKEVVNDRISHIRFTFPAVKKGSIIEYQYTSEMKHYGGLDDWIFQDEIPTLKSCFLLTILPNTEFSWIVSKKREYPMKVVPYQSQGKIYYEMDNVPGLRSEPFINAPKDYLQKVAFKLSSYKGAFGGKVEVNDTWEKLAKDLSDDFDLGKAIKKDLPGIDILRTQLATETTQSGKLKKIYEYVQSNFTWNKLDSRFVSDGLKKIMDKRVGTSGELNMLLVNLLDIFGIDAYPMAVAERSFGRVIPEFPSIDQFNKTVAYAFADGKDYVLDATEKYCPPQLVPYSLLNTDALIINKKSKGLVHINSGSGAFTSNVSIISQLDKNGILTGKTTIENKDYALQYFLQQVKSDEKRFIKEYLIDQNEGIELNNFTSTLSTGNEDTLGLLFDFRKDLQDNNDFILFNYNLFTGQSKNPFTKDIRFSDINFGYPYAITIHHQLNVPPETKMDIPEDRSITTPQRDITITRKLERKGDQLEIWISFTQTTPFFSVQNYSTLKAFYTDMLKMLNEPVVIKLKK